MIKFLFLYTILMVSFMHSQTIKGLVTLSGEPVKNAVIVINKSDTHLLSDSSGHFKIKVEKAPIKIHVYYPGCISYFQKLNLVNDTFLHIQLQPDTLLLNEVYIESTKPLLNKKPDPFNTEVYDACVLSSSSATNLFEGAQNISGLRPQLNCNVCNTGDIHINGMEGAYTNVLIDGMPVIGGIASVYGLSGISSDIIEKMEVNRYPGSVLYGIDNIGGTINIITKKPRSEKLQTSINAYTSVYLDNNLQISTMKKTKNYAYVNSLDIMYFDKIFDTNNDGFTDVTLQKRISAFHKSVFTTPDSSDIQIMARVLFEDRWGGQTNWNKSFRGTDSIYGERILTNRYESVFKWPFKLRKGNVENNLSYNYHYQNSYYGTLFFEAKQHNLYHQSFMNFKFRTSDHLLGVAFRYLNYTDNTAIFQNSPSYRVWVIPTIFTENTLKLNKNLNLVFSARYDYHNIHKHIFTPRVAMLYRLLKSLNIRSGFTTGFRPVQLFTEDHAALTGARKISIEEKLLPEKSYVYYFNAQSNIVNTPSILLSADVNLWYIYFSNRIVPDYSHPDKIIYYNLGKKDYSVNRGISAQLQCVYKNQLQIVAGASVFDNYVWQNYHKKRLMLSEPWSVNWVFRYMVNKLTLEYTGNVYGSMFLPKAGNLDPRPDKSPVYSIQNIQLKYALKNIELTIGIKNLLNFTPDKNIPFLIARSDDPFDKKVVFDNEGNPVVTPDNPYALTFDPTYTYASMQKSRLFINLNMHF